MTTDDQMTRHERALRDRLQIELLPPRTPDRLAYAIDRLADDELERASHGRLEMLVRAGASRWVRAAIAIVAIVAIAGGTLLMSTSLRTRVPVAATPVPTLPAITQPSLPPDATSPTGVGNGRWLDGSHAFLVSASNDLFTTSDGGQAWHQQGRLPTDPSLGFDMLDTSHGYVGDVSEASDGFGLIAYTTADGGKSWQRHAVATVATPAHGDLYAEVHFSDPRHGIALGSTMTPYPGGSTQPVFCQDFGTNPKGEACNVIRQVCAGFATDDGGTTWTPLDSPPCLSIGGVRWFTPTLGMNWALDQSVATTMDGGRTWHAGSLPGVIDGKSFLSGGAVLTQVSGSTLRLAGIVIIDGETLQPMTVWESPDAGATWHVAYTAEPPSTTSAPDANGDVETNRGPAAMWAFSADHWIGLVSIDGASRAPGGLFETWDAGRSWAEVAEPQLLAGNTWQWADRLHGMLEGGYWVYNGQDGWTSVGHWLMTNDGGQTWHQVPF